jgi:hypothetical protein
MISNKNDLESILHMAIGVTIGFCTGCLFIIILRLITGW